MLLVTKLVRHINRSENRQQRHEIQSPACSRARASEELNDGNHVCVVAQASIASFENHLVFLALELRGRSELSVRRYLQFLR